MTRDEAAKILAAHNKWRRSEADDPQVSPAAIGAAIDVAVKALAGDPTDLSLKAAQALVDTITEHIQRLGRADHPPYALGQVYRHRQRGSLHVIAQRSDDDDPYMLVCVRSGKGYFGSEGKQWTFSGLFGDAEHAFEYAGLAKDVLHEAAAPAVVSGPEKPKPAPPEQWHCPGETASEQPAGTAHASAGVRSGCLYRSRDGRCLQGADVSGQPEKVAP